MADLISSIIQDKIRKAFVDLKDTLHNRQVIFHLHTGEEVAASRFADGYDGISEQVTGTLQCSVTEEDKGDDKLVFLNRTFDKQGVRIKLLEDNILKSSNLYDATTGRLNINTETDSFTLVDDNREYKIDAIVHGGFFTNVPLSYTIYGFRNASIA